MDKKDGMDLTVSYVSEFKFENGNVSLRDMYAASLQRISELEAENAKLHDELHAIKYEIMGGEDVPGSASAATLDDIKKEIERKLEAALPQWRLLKTSKPPEDETPIMIWDGKRRRVIRADDLLYPYMIDREEITHWMPLPQPPEVKT